VLRYHRFTRIRTLGSSQNTNHAIEGGKGGSELLGRFFLLFPTAFRCLCCYGVRRGRRRSRQRGIGIGAEATRPGSMRHPLQRFDGPCWSRRSDAIRIVTTHTHTHAHTLSLIHTRTTRRGGCEWQAAFSSFLSAPPPTVDDDMTGDSETDRQDVRGWNMSALFPALLRAMKIRKSRSSI